MTTWISTTVLDCAYEEQMDIDCPESKSDSVRFRHRRRSFRPDGGESEWSPGPSPDRERRQSEVHARHTTCPYGPGVMLNRERPRQEFFVPYDELERTISKMQEHLDNVKSDA